MWLNRGFTRATLRRATSIRVRSHYLEDGIETGATFSYERFVKTLVGQAGITYDLHQTFDMDDIAIRLFK